MSKKQFIALADLIRSQQFTVPQIDALADFCQAQNPRFLRARWLDYIAGRCGKNGDKK